MGRHNNNRDRKDIPRTAGATLRFNGRRLVADEASASPEAQQDWGVVMPVIGKFEALRQRLAEMRAEEGIRSRIITPTDLILANSAEVNPVVKASALTHHTYGGNDTEYYEGILRINWGLISREVVGRDTPREGVPFSVIDVAIRTVQARSGGRTSRLSAVIADEPTGDNTRALESMRSVALGNKRYDVPAAAIGQWLVPLAEVDLPYATMKEILESPSDTTGLQDTFPDYIHLGAPKLVSGHVE